MRMGDVIIVLPGITGSVLEKDGREIWALSGHALSTYLRSFGSSLEKLEIQGVDDPDADDLGDGVTATRLMPDTHIIPGFWKIDGYGALTKSIRDWFAVEEGKNFFEFPYDWRRDNRVSARKLERLIAAVLPAWRKSTDNPRAKVILIAHSMGGLISRYYVEAMQGWKDCRMLISFGTPYRGSVKALNYLFNGYKVGPTDLSGLFRSCTSVYQLLPTYAMCKYEGKTLHAAELPVSDVCDIERTRKAREFHQTIEDEVAEHMNIEEYRKHFRLLPVIGSDQPTLNSAELSAGNLLASAGLPSGIDILMAYGDGTVPLVSAVPLEASREFRMPFYGEVHGSIQNNPRVLDSLRHWLRQSQVEHLENLRNEPDTNAIEEEVRPFLRLHIEDAYRAGEPVTVRVEVGGVEGSPERVTAALYPLEGVLEPRRQELAGAGREWHTEIPGLSAGCYRVQVRCRGADLEVAPPPVTDVFMVV